VKLVSEWGDTTGIYGDGVRGAVPYQEGERVVLKRALPWWMSVLALAMS